MDRRAELLSPAGDMERLEMALLYGADAVYLAGREFGLRASAGNFDSDQMELAARMCREKGVRLYAAVNAIPRNDEMRRLPGYLEQLRDMGVDAIIAADMGVFTLAKKYAEGVALHVSTQAGIVNYESARAWYELGASRVVLARELSLDEITEIRAKTPQDLELEAFVHGAMCMAVSGRCLLSEYLAGRDPNRGSCAQPCRWKYHLMEESRPGEYMEIFEDGGSYILNSKDLCMINHLPEMLGAGITSLKIEGRMKSAYYTAVTTNAYRHVLDAVLEGEKPGGVWLGEVNKVSHRQFCTGFYFGGMEDGQYYEDSMYISDCDVVCVVENCDAGGNAVLSQRNKFLRGDTLELLTPTDKPVSFVVTAMQNAEGEEIDAAPHPVMEVRMKLPHFAPKGSLLRKEKEKLG